MQPVGSKEHTRHTQTDSLLRWIESSVNLLDSISLLEGTEYTRVCTTDQTVMLAIRVTVLVVSPLLRDTIARKFSD